MLLQSRPHDAERRLAAAREVANARRVLNRDERFCRWAQWWAERSALIELGDPAEEEVRGGMVQLSRLNRHAGDAFFAATWGQGVELRVGDFQRADAMAADWAAGMAAHDAPSVVADLVPVYRMTITAHIGRNRHRANRSEPAFGRGFDGPRRATDRRVGVAFSRPGMFLRRPFSDEIVD